MPCQDAAHIVPKVLSRLAIKRGSQDNITVLFVDLKCTVKQQKDTAIEHAVLEMPQLFPAPQSSGVQQPSGAAVAHDKHDSSVVTRQQGSAAGQQIPHSSAALRVTKLHASGMHSKSSISRPSQQQPPQDTSLVIPRVSAVCEVTLKAGNRSDGSYSLPRTVNTTVKRARIDFDQNHECASACGMAPQKATVYSVTHHGAAHRTVTSGVVHLGSPRSASLLRGGVAVVR